MRVPVGPGQVPEGVVDAYPPCVRDDLALSRAPPSARPWRGRGAGALDPCLRLAWRRAFARGTAIWPSRPSLLTFAASSRRRRGRPRRGLRLRAVLARRARRARTRSGPPVHRLRGRRRRVCCGVLPGCPGSQQLDRVADSLASEVAQQAACATRVGGLEMERLGVALEACGWLTEDALDCSELRFGDRLADFDGLPGVAVSAPHDCSGHDLPSCRPPVAARLPTALLIRAGGWIGLDGPRHGRWLGGRRRWLPLRGRCSGE